MLKLYTKYKKAARIAALALAGIAPASAATPVAGPIRADAAWTVAGSPYLLDGDVTIEDGASVSVEPGVTIRMGAGANLRVVAGALSAQGTAAAPIVVTSAKASPQPGDWGLLAFEDGTVDASTVLSHVEVRYGSGIVIERASPRIDDTAITQNAGPAIAIDLASSPVGRGLSATGNTLDGVLVPAGVVVGDVTWRLRGIPYVVASGLVEIGRPPFNLSPAVLPLVAGHTGELSINLPEPAPAGGTSVTLEAGANGVASVESPVLVPAGALQATAVVTAVRVGETGITATTAGGATAQASVVVSAQPALALSSSATSIPVGRTASWTVSRNVANGAVVVDLAASAAGVVSAPASVTIADGHASASFDVHGVSPGETLLRARAAGYLDGMQHLNVHVPQILAPQTAAVAAGSTEPLAVNLGDPAPAGGLVVAVTSDSPATLEVPATVTVPAGATSFVVPLHSPGSVSASAQVTLAADGYAPASTSVYIYRIDPYLERQGDVSLPQGTRRPTTLRLSSPAPAGGLTIALSSLVPGIVDVEPAEVTIPAGATGAPVTLVGLREGHTVLRLAGVNLPGVAHLQNVDVTPPLHLELSTPYDEPVLLGKALSARVSIRAVGDDGRPVELPYAYSVTLSSDDPAKVRVPAGTITMAANQAISEVSIDGVDVTTAPVRIRAQVTSPADAGIADGAGLSVSVVMPQLAFDGIGDRVASTGERGGFNFHWSTPGSTTAQERPLRLQVIDAAPSGIVDGLYASPSDTAPATDFTQPSAWFGAPASPGRFKVRATLDGVGEWTSPEQVVAIPSFRFDDATLALGLGLTTGASELRLRTTVGDGDAYLALPPDFALVSSDPAKVEIRESHDYSPGEKRFRLRALGLTAPGQPVAIRATGTGRAAAQLDVTVGAAQIAFFDLANARSPASGADAFEVGWAGQYSPSAAQAAVVDVALAAGATPGVLPDPAVTAAAGGAATVTIPAGATRGGAALAVRTPLARGTYRLAASIAGAQAGVSALQTVDAGVLVLREAWRSPDYFPAGRLMQSTARVTLRADADGAEIPAPNATTVHLVSRAPDWVRVPASVVIPQGESSVEFDVAGVEATGDEPVGIDAYLGEATAPSASMPVRVFPTELTLSTRTVRPLDDGPADVWAEADFYYPGCGVLAITGKQAPGAQATGMRAPPDYCKGDGLFAQAQAIPLEIVSDGTPPVAPGFVTEDGTPASALTFAAGANQADPLRVAAPSRAGTYRVRATFGGETIDGDTVVVGSARLVASRDAVRIGTGTVDDLRLDLRIGDAWADAPPMPLTVSVACADPSICSTPATVVLESNGVDVPLTGLAAGRTTLTFSAPGMPPAAPVTVDVVKPQFVVAVYPPALPVDADGYLNVRLSVPGAGALRAAQPMAVALTSDDPAIARVMHGTVTIAAGETEVGTDGAIRAVRAGETAIVASNATAQTSVSGVVTVTGTGN